MKTLLKSILAVTVLSLTASASAQTVTVHDCRISTIGIIAAVKGNVLSLRAVFRGYDGLPLSIALCPDMTGPTWGTDRAVATMDATGYRITLEGATGEMIVVSVATFQHPDKTFTHEKRILF